ncbi:MAG TPA: hypothetical protein VF297_05225 [Pyrinomonadaceae bacterium]
MAYDRTELKRKLFDRERARKWEGVSLVLVLDAGTAEQSELEIDGGWLPKEERKFGEVNSMYTIEVTDREELIADVMNRADRLRLGEVLYQFNHKSPTGQPSLWVLYAEELKAGGLR